MTKQETMTELRTTGCPTLRGLCTSCLYSLTSNLKTSVEYKLCIVLNYVTMTTTIITLILTKSCLYQQGEQETLRR